ncbi:uncharacterized protein LOC134259767 [Saccostrea cucullata]|uniref:uncharacterized protein LOC134259767 n=1 Tax=Saccostrea cuccullata TaxID=36930 RepID=UPI002ED5EAB2
MRNFVFVLLSLFGLSTARNWGFPYDNFNTGYVESLPPRVTSLTMHFPLGNPFRPGENFVDLLRTGPYYLGNGYRGYTFYPTVGVSGTYNRMFGGQNPFSGFGIRSRGPLGGNLGGGLFGESSLLGINSGRLLGQNLRGSLLGGTFGGKFG